MTHALQKFSAALFGWIPDLSGIPPRRRATLGFAVSIFLHLLIIAVIALLIGGEERDKISFAKPKIPPPIELTILPPEPEPEPMMPFTMAPPIQPFIDSRGLDIAQEAALNPLFQSDENMRAASESPASGDVPLPSQEGRDRPFNAFKTQRSLLGTARPEPFPSTKAEPSLAAVPPTAPPPTPAVAQQDPPPNPAEPADKAEPESAAPNAMEDLKKVDAPRDDEIALTARPATPSPTARKQAAAMIKTTQKVRLPDQHAMLTTPAPQPQPSRESGYQPELEQNRIEGSISNRGRKAVDSVATPLAKYRKQVNDAIGSRWYRYIRDARMMSLIAPGSVKINFFIDQQGRVHAIQRESNRSNESFADLCERAVHDAGNEIKDLKLPAGATLPLKDGRLEFSLTFTFYNL